MANKTAAKLENCETAKLENIFYQIIALGMFARMHTIGIVKILQKNKRSIREIYEKV